MGFVLLWQAAFNISNAAITVFLKAFRYFILLLGRAFGCSPIANIVSGIPITHGTLYQRLSIDKNTHIDYVVCPKCLSLYEQTDCTVHASNGVESKTCCHIPTPNHPHRSKRNACGCLLMKKQHTKYGIVLSPRKVFPYRSIIKSLTLLLSKPGYVDLCEQWRQRSTSDDLLGDVYDGNVWKSFMSEEYDNFLTVPHSYLLTLNVDWFKPFVRGTTYSTGALYLTVQNLPRQERYRIENLLLVGILPGPSEPSLIMNSYLTPMVEELLQLWQGVMIPIETCHGKMQIRVRAALSCVACDIPASRKVCGFLSHNAILGCNKCLKRFKHYRTENGGTITDYSGYDRQTWEIRTCATHRELVKELLKEKTPTALHDAESKLGLRYSILLSLPYFDPVRFTVIDPMHNLFLGSGKHAFEVWVDNGLITKKHLARFEEMIRKFVVPNDAGRIPSSIGSGYGGFTANQWSNWITVFSPILLKEVLPNEHLRCWLMFVRACYLLKSRVINKCDVQSADLLLLHFCKEFQRLYGESACTPNMHLHTHLKDCLLDYGPPHAFWCYPFERYNGILGQYHTNRRAIESQLLKKFCHSQAYVNGDIPLAEFYDYIPTESMKQRERIQRDTNDYDHVHMPSSPLRFIASFALSTKSVIKPLNPFKIKALSSEHARQLQEIYNQLYPSKSVAHMSHFYHEYGRVSIDEDIIGSEKPGPNNHSSATIAAYWPVSGESLSRIDYNERRVGTVQYYVQHTIEFHSDGSIETEKLKHLFCYVLWKQISPNTSYFGQSAIVCTNSYELPSLCSFLPVQRILAKCAHTVIPLNLGSHEESYFVACPIPLKCSL